LPVSVAGMTLPEEEITLPIGNVYEGEPVFNPADPANKNVFWKSSKTSVATVAADGKIKGIASGVATISAVTKDGIKKANLKVIVGDGSITAIDESDNSEEGLSLFPNPTSGKISLRYHLNKTQEVSLDVFNTGGVVVRTTTFQSDAGENVVSFSMEDFSPGIYFIRLRTTESTQMKKFAKR